MKMKSSGLRNLRSFLEMASLLVMATSFVLFGFIYSSYPEGNLFKAPVFAWMLDDNKTELFLPLLISAAVMGFIFLLYRFPKLYRYPYTINADNIEMQRILAKIMLSLELIISGVFFATIYVCMYFAELNILSPACIYFFISYIALAAVTAICYLQKAKKYK